MQGPAEGCCWPEVCEVVHPGSTSSFPKQAPVMWFCVVWKERGPCWHVVLGHFRSSAQCRALPLSSCTIVPTERKRRGPALSAELVREGDFPLCVPPGPLALLQENSAVFQGRLRPCLKRMKEFGRPRNAWIAAGGGRMLWTCRAVPFSMDVNEAWMCVFVIVCWVYTRVHIHTKANKAIMFSSVALGSLYLQIRVE